MRFRFPVLTLAAVTAAGCVEQVTPTEPLTEQAVFNALGGLHIGESIALSGAAAGQILLGGTAAAGEFVVIPFHASVAPNANLVLEVRGESVGGGSAVRIPMADRSPTVDPAIVAGWSMHEALHGRQTAAVAALLRSARPGLSRLPGTVPRADLSGTNAFVGQLVDINANALGPACTADDRRTGRVEAITERAIVVGDIDNPGGGFTRADYEEFGRQFDQLVHPAVTEYFPEPTDIDQNGKVVIFFTRAVNELTQPQDEGFIGGFFWARDLFPIADCGVSNAGEIFFVLAPDPNAEASHIAHTREQVFRRGVATIGHEYQHLINAGRRIYFNGANAFEETWLDEGLSHVAEELIFYRAAGLAPESNVTVELLRGNAAYLDAVNRYGVQNLLRYSLYLEDVTRESPTGRDRLETRGAAWSFLRYAADHDARPQTQFFRLLGDSPLTGFDNLSSVLSDAPLDWFQRWGISVYTDDFVEAADSLFQQPSWNFRNLLPVLLQEPGGPPAEFPLEVRNLAAGATERLVLLSTTSGFIEVEGTPGTTSRLVTTSGSAPPPDALRVTVIRTD